MAAPIMLPALKPLLFPKQCRHIVRVLPGGGCWWLCWDPVCTAYTAKGSCMQLSEFDYAHHMSRSRASLGFGPLLLAQTPHLYSKSNSLLNPNF